MTNITFDHLRNTSFNGITVTRAVEKDSTDQSFFFFFGYYFREEFLSTKEGFVQQYLFQFISLELVFSCWFWVFTNLHKNYANLCV